jgi:hypothetical protein
MKQQKRNKMLNCCIDTQHTHKISMTEKKKKTQKAEQEIQTFSSHSLTHSRFEKNCSHDSE